MEMNNFAETMETIGGTDDREFAAVMTGILGACVDGFSGSLERIDAIADKVAGGASAQSCKSARTVLTSLGLLEKCGKDAPADKRLERTTLKWCALAAGLPENVAESALQSVTETQQPENFVNFKMNARQDRTLAKLDEYVSQKVMYRELDDRLRAEELSLLRALIQKENHDCEELEKVLQEASDEVQRKQKISASKDRSRSFIPSSLSLMPKEIEQILFERAANSGSRTSLGVPALPPPPGSSKDNLTIGITNKEAYSTVLSKDDHVIAEKLRAAREHVRKAKAQMNLDGPSVFADIQAQQKKLIPPCDAENATIIQHYTQPIDLVPELKRPTPPSQVNLVDFAQSEPFDFNNIVVQFRVCSTEETKPMQSPFARSRSGRALSVESSNLPQLGTNNAADLNNGANANGQPGATPVKEVDLPSWRLHDWHQDENGSGVDMTDQEYEKDFSDEAYLHRHESALTEAKAEWEAHQEERKRLKEEEKLRRQQIQQLSKARSPRLGRRSSISSTGSTEHVPAVDQKSNPWATASAVSVEIPTVEQVVSEEQVKKDSTSVESGFVSSKKRKAEAISESPLTPNRIKGEPKPSTSIISTNQDSSEAAPPIKRGRGRPPKTDKKVPAPGATSTSASSKVVAAKPIRPSSNSPATTPRTTRSTAAAAAKAKAQENTERRTSGRKRKAKIR